MSRLVVDVKDEVKELIEKIALKKGITLKRLVLEAVSKYSNTDLLKKEVANK